jgi:hypothetical protein
MLLQQWLPLAVALWGLTILTSQLFPALGPGTPAGWDRSPHFFLASRMMGYLENGTWHGYNTLWYAGYPEFALYAPLFYMVVAATTLLTTLPIETVFNAITVALPFFIVGAFCVAARSLLPQTRLTAAMVVVLLILTTRPALGPLGLGIGGLLETGLIANYAALPLLLLLIRELHRPTHSPLRIGVCWGLIVLTHILTAIFAALTVALYLAMNRTTLVWKPVLLGGVGAAAISAWWWIPMFEYLPFASDQTIGLTWDLPDPLFGILPGLSRMQLVEFMTTGKLFLGNPQLDTALLALQLLPWTALFTLLFLPLGFLTLLRAQKPFLPVLFTVTLILLPRDFFTLLIDLGIHYYRFTQPIVFVGGLLSVVGLNRMLMRLAELSLIRRTVLQFLLLGTFIFGTTASLNRDFIFEFQREANYTYPPPFRFLEQFPEYEDAMLLAQEVAREPNIQRVAVESSFNSFPELGTPHFFTTILPLRFNIPVIPGLLAESAYSSQFINPTLASYSNHIVWGRFLFYSPKFWRLPMTSIVERLRLFGASHIIATSSRYAKALRSVVPAAVEPFATSGRYSAFRIRSPKALVTGLSIAPPLFVDAGGISFQEFSRHWFQQRNLLQNPVVWSSQSYEELDQEEQNAFSGFIVSAGSNGELLRSWVARAAQDTRPYLFLNATPSNPDYPRTNARFIAKLGRATGATQLEHTIRELFPAATENAVEHALRGDTITFNHYGFVMIRYGFSPKITVQGGERPSYLATPFMVATRAKGATVVELR